ncbi:MAG TPA: KH domain-containing protein [Acidimicrobiales bacterium]|nr:KH domain-containing protein [Acidimicrobiales bacterium]
MPEPEIPERVLTYIASQLVDDQEAVQVEADHNEGSVDLRLSVGSDDMGRVIGRRGRNAQAIRTVVRAAGARAGVDATVDIVD